MKKLLLFCLALLLISGPAYAESAMDYALWLESVLPGANFSSAEIPEFVLQNLGADYEFIARSDEKYGRYIAGVRRESAPALPDDIFVSTGGSFETALFRAMDGAGNIYYDFILSGGVQIQAYDGLEHIIIHANEAQTEYMPFAPAASILFSAADSMGRAQLEYACKHGFSLQDSGKPQLCLEVHNIESWRCGATNQPLSFYYDMDMPADLLGERWLEESDLISFTRIPIGIYMKNGETHCQLVVSETGVKGVETYEPHRLYEAGPGFDTLMDTAEKLLGYRPGNAGFMDKEITRAELEWQHGKFEIEAPDRLNRLKAMLAGADFSVGSVNCPSPCFLTLEFSDGSSASLAVAVNSFDLFFYNGMFFTAGNGELLEIFNLNAEDIYV